MDAAWMSTDNWMDKADVLHNYNGILLSHKKEQNWVICSDVENLELVIQSKLSQKENQILYINAYM